VNRINVEHCIPLEPAYPWSLRTLPARMSTG